MVTDWKQYSPDVRLADPDTDKGLQVAVGVWAKSGVPMRKDRKTANDPKLPRETRRGLV
jgi:hypothetical protein